MYIADYDTLKENIFNSNKYSAITCTTAKPRSDEEIVRLSAKAQPTTQAVSFSKVSSAEFEFLIIITFLPY